MMSGVSPIFAGSSTTGMVCSRSSAASRPRRGLYTTGRWPRSDSPTATSRTYSSVPVRCARIRFVSRTRSGGSDGGDPMTPQRVGQRPHVLAKRDESVVGAGLHPIRTERLVVGHLVRIPPVPIAGVDGAQVLAAERLRSVPCKRVLHFALQFLVRLRRAQFAGQQPIVEADVQGLAGGGGAAGLGASLERKAVTADSAAARGRRKANRGVNHVAADVVRRIEALDGVARDDIGSGLQQRRRELVGKREKTRVIAGEDRGVDLAIGHATVGAAG